MAEQRSAPTAPPQPWFDPKTGNATEAFRRFILGERGRITNVNSGQAQLLAAQQAAEANAAAAAAAANQAAAAAVAASGSTETDYDAQAISVLTSSYVTKLTCNLDHAGGGDYTISATLQPTLVSTDAPLMSSGVSFTGDWQIIENPNAHVLASGTFSVGSALQSAEGGVSFYINTVTFSADGTFGDNETGAVTVALQLRSDNANTVTGLTATMLVEWA